MLYREVYLQNREVLANAATRTVDINLTDPLTGIWVEFRFQNGATSCQALTAATCVNSIEVLDGADVLYSMDGFEALAMTAYHLGHIPQQLITEIGGNTQNLLIWIPFGRFYGDEQLAFDATRFVNPQLRINWALTNLGAVAATTFATGTARLTVVAEVMAGGPAPMGFLTTKEIYSYATAAAGTVYVDLPVDYPYKRLQLRHWLAAKSMSGVCNHVKIHADQQKHVLFDKRMTDVQRDCTLRMPPFSYSHSFKQQHLDTIYLILKSEEAASFNGENLDSLITYQNWGLGEGVIGFFRAGIQNVVDTNFYGHISGFCPHATVDLPFGKQDVIEDWLPADMFKNVRLELGQAVLAGVGAVTLQQMRPY